MKKIIAFIHPFVVSQAVYIYEDGNQIQNFEISLPEISNTVFKLAYNYNINQIDLIGTKDYNNKIVQQIKEKEIEKYNKNKLIIKNI